MDISAKQILLLVKLSCLLINSTHCEDLFVFLMMSENLRFFLNFFFQKQTQNLQLLVCISLKNNQTEITQIQNLFCFKLSLPLHKSHVGHDHALCKMSLLSKQGKNHSRCLLCTQHHSYRPLFNKHLLGTNQK